MPRKQSPAKLALKPIQKTWSATGKDYITEVAWSPDQLQLVGTDASGSISVINPANGKVQLSWHAHDLGALRARWSSSGRFFASCGQDGKARVYDGSSFAGLVTVDHGNTWVEHLAWHAKKEIFLTAAGKDLRLWAADGSLMQEYAKHSSTIADVTWNPKAPDQFATSCYNGARLWDLTEADEKRLLEWKGSLLNIAYSPNGKVLAAGCQDGAAHIWLLPEGDDLFMNGYPTKVRELAWDASSRYMATGGGEEVIIWDFSGKGPSGKEPLVFPGHESYISVLSFAHQGLKLASGGLDGNVFVWEVGNPRANVLVVSGDSEVSSLVWRSDGKALAVGFASGEIALFTL